MKYLSIGHVCMDVDGRGYRLGGSVSYVSKLLNKLEAEPSVLTSFGSDFLFEKEFHGIPIELVPAAETTIFENIYSNQTRTQILHKKASDIYPDYPGIKTDILHLCPIADEVRLENFEHLHPDTFVIITPQGWLRQWDTNGRIEFKPINWNELAFADVVIISSEDVPESMIDEIRDAIAILVVTNNEDGAVAYADGEAFFLPSFPVNVVDATGAGDAFAVGFATSYYKSKNIWESLAMGHSISSLCIESIGLDNLPDLNLIDRRYGQYCRMYL